MDDCNFDEKSQVITNESITPKFSHKEQQIVFTYSVVDTLHGGFTISFEQKIWNW